MTRTRDHRPDPGHGPVVQRRASGSPGQRALTDGLPASSAVERASSSTAEPLRADVRERFEGSLGTDLSAVRVHTGHESVAAADAVGAQAYAVGNDIHFGAGRYQPDDPFGLHLIAHEVVHTQQQAGGAPVTQHKLEVSVPGDAAEVEADAVADRMVSGAAATVSLRAPATVARAEWGAPYQSQDPSSSAGPDAKDPWTASEFKAAIPGEVPKENKDNHLFAMQNASEQVNNGARGTKSRFRLSKDDLLVILEHAGTGIDRIAGAPGTDQRKVNEGKLASYMALTGRAFEIMGVDTVESQAQFIAHSAGETVMSKFTEGQTENYVDDPKDVVVSTSMARASTAEADGKQHLLGPMRYDEDNVRSIDPLDAIDGKDEDTFDQTFIGRGPIQATHRKAYVKALMYMEKRLDGLPPGSPQATELSEAIDAIKADPSAAANPKYTFLFTAAQMHASGMVHRSARFGANESFKTGARATAGVTGGNEDHRAGIKEKAYAKAHELLSRDANYDPELIPQDPANMVRPGPVRATMIRPRPETP